MSHINYQIIRSTPINGVQTDMTQESFGTKLKKWRELEGVNQAELARRIDVSPNYVSNLERDFSPSAKGGKPQPSVEVVDRIARALHVSVAEVRLAAGYAPPNGKGGEETHELEEFGVLFSGWAEASEEAKAETITAIKMIAESFQRRRRTHKKKQS